MRPREVGLPRTGDRAADAGDRGHGDGDQPHPGDAAAVRYAESYSKLVAAATRGFADALHDAKHRAFIDAFGYEPDCLACYPDTETDPRGNATASAAFAQSVFGSVPDPSPSQLAAALATSSRLPPRPAVSPASDMPVSAVNVR